MQLPVIFSDQAIDTFSSIGEQLQNEWGDKALMEFRKRTFNVTESIAYFPMMFKAVDISHNIRKAFIHKNCSLFYKVDETKIEILLG